MTSWSARDGIHSTVRAQLFGPEQPNYTGNVAWRGLVPADRVPHLDLGMVTGVWMGPNRSIVQYYVAAGRTFNWIVVAVVDVLVSARRLSSSRSGSTAA